MKRILLFSIKTVDCISSLLHRLCEVGVVLITVIISLEVLARSIFNTPFHWTDEVASYIFVFIVFMGAAEVAREEKHITVELILDRLDKRRRMIINLFNLCLALFWCVLIAWAAWKSTLLAYNLDITSSSLIRFPLYISYSFLSIGLTLLLMQLMIFFGKGLRDILSLRRGMQK